MFTDECCIYVIYKDLDSEEDGINSMTFSVFQINSNHNGVQGKALKMDSGGYATERWSYRSSCWDI